MGMMKQFKQAALWGGLSLALATGSALAQGNPPTATPTPTPGSSSSGKANIAVNRPVIVPPNDKATGSQAPKPPDRGNLPKPPSSVQDLVRDFQAARQAYLEEQKELRRQLREATDEQRAAIRSQLKASLDNWLEIQRARVLEMREQARRIKETVPDLKDVVDSAKEERRHR